MFDFNSIDQAAIDGNLLAYFLLLISQILFDL